MTIWTKFDEFWENFRMGGGPFPIRKIMLCFFGKGKALQAPISRTKAQHFFPKIGWGAQWANLGHHVVELNLIQ